EENIEAQNISVALADTSWVATVNYNLLRKSLSTSELGRDDASYIRLSLGEFFAQRSEALGCLGGGNSVKRPSFGYFISSPEKREPVALISKSDVSGSDLEKRVAHPNQDLSSGDLDEQSETQPSEGSITLRVEALEGTSLVDESDVTLTANKDKTEVVAHTFPEGKLRLSYHGSAIRSPEKNICGFTCVFIFLDSVLLQMSLIFFHQFLIYM
ncbi:Hypothetical predicted protein, partial [Marmota monax]